MVEDGNEGEEGGEAGGRPREGGPVYPTGTERRLGQDVDREQNERKNQGEADW